MMHVLQLILAILLCSQLATAEDLTSVTQRPVGRVSTEGVSDKESAVILSALGIVSGQPLDFKRIQAGLQDLYKRNKVQNLTVDATPRGRAVDIYVRIQKQARCRRFVIEGDDPEIEQKIRSASPIAEGQPVQSRNLEVLESNLRDLYQAKGFQGVHVKVIVEPLPDSDLVDITATVVPGEPTQVRKVSVSGGTPEENARLAEELGVRPGKIFLRAELDRGVERINRLLVNEQYVDSRVEDVGIEVSKDGLYADLRIAVRFGKKYEFHFVGNETLSEIQIRSLVGKDIASKAEPIPKVRELILQRYRALGYPNVAVDSRTEVDAERHVTVVYFTIEEGARAWITSVTFTSNSSLSSGELEALFFESAPAVVARKLYWEEGVREAGQNLQAKLRTMGFATARVQDARAVFDASKKHVVLQVDCDLGVKTYISGIEIVGAKAILPERIVRVLPIAVGDALDIAKVEFAKRAIADVYLEEGFAEVKVSDTDDPLVYSRDRRDVSLRFRVNEGNKFTVRSVEIEGNERTQKKVILREVSVKPGDPFSLTRLRQCEEDVSLLGLFSRVEVVPSEVPNEPLRRDIKVVVRETKPGVGEFGVGGRYEDPMLRVRGFMAFAYRNLMGLNHTASSRTELALPMNNGQLLPFIEYSLILGYRAPYPWDLPFTYAAQGGIDSFQLSVDGPTVLTRSRIENRIEKQFSRKLTTLYRLHRLERNTVSTYRGLGAAVDEVNTIGSTGPSVILDFRDDMFNPASGSFHSIDLEFAHPALLSKDNAFYMAIARNSFYVTPLSWVSLSFFVGGGYAKSVADGVAVPAARLLNDLALGGQGSIRGVAPKVYAPTIGVTESGFLNGRGEIIFSTFGDLKFALFFDSGQIYPNMVAQPPRSGFGVGFRYKTPVGPVVVDIAQGLPSDGPVKFYFTVGTI